MYVQQNFMYNKTKDGFFLWHPPRLHCIIQVALFKTVTGGDRIQLYGAFKFYIIGVYWYNDVHCSLFNKTKGGYQVFSV